MNYEELDILYRSRLTLLEILKENGYDTSKYEKFGPWEIEAMVAGGQENLMMDMKRPPVEGQPERCIVRYSLNKLKQRLSGFMSDLRDITEEDDTSIVDSGKTEVICIVLEDVADVFHAAALNAWTTSKLRLRFFKAHNLLFDPRTHILVPQHTKLPAEEHTEFLKQNYIKSKGNLPFIRFHEDMIARTMGLVPGDIVKIVRPSPSSGTYEVYRVCMP